MSPCAANFGLCAEERAFCALRTRKTMEVYAPPRMHNAAVFRILTAYVKEKRRGRGKKARTTGEESEEA